LRAEAARAEAAAGAAGAALADAERRRAALRSAATQTADARRAAAAVQTLPAAAIACDATQTVRSDCACWAATLHAGFIAYSLHVVLHTVL